MAQKTEFLFTLIAILPLNFIFDRKGWHQSVVYDVIIMSLRIIKLRPIAKVFKWLHPINLPLFRVLEVIYYNYSLRHLAILNFRENKVAPLQKGHVRFRSKVRNDRGNICK